MASASLIRASLVVVLAAGLSAGCGRQISDLTYPQADLTVRVLDERNNAPIEGAQVDADGATAVTDPAGYAKFGLSATHHAVVVRHQRYMTRAATVLVFPGSSKTMLLAPRREAPASPEPSGSPAPGPSGAPGASPAPGLSPLPRPTPISEPHAVLLGNVKDLYGKRVVGATVFVEAPAWGLPYGLGTTDAKGDYHVEGLPVGQELKITAMADGYESRVRYVSPTSKTQLDFVGAFGLRPAAGGVAPSTMLAIAGEVKDTQGRSLDGIFIKVTSNVGRYPFDEVALVRNGRYEMSVPAGIELRFSAAKRGFRPISFVETVSTNARQVDFTGPRALEPAPILEGQADAEP